MTKELLWKSEVFKEVPGRSHHSFPNARKTTFAAMNWNDFERWFGDRKSKFISNYIPVDDDFV